LYYASNVTIQGSTITACNITVLNRTVVPFSIYIGYSSTVLLTNTFYGSTVVFSNTFSPTFSNSTTNWPFYMYLKNIGTSNQQISIISAGTTYYPGGPAGCNLFCATSNLTGNSPLTILYAGTSDVSTWKLY